MENFIYQQAAGWPLAGEAAVGKQLASFSSLVATGWVFLAFSPIPFFDRCASGWFRPTSVQPALGASGAGDGA
jgi:hypothetical protein